LARTFAQVRSELAACGLLELARLPECVVDALIFSDQVHWDRCRRVPPAPRPPERTLALAALLDAHAAHRVCQTCWPDLLSCGSAHAFTRTLCALFELFDLADQVEELAELMAAPASVLVGAVPGRLPVLRREVNSRLHMAGLQPGVGSSSVVDAATNALVARARASLLSAQQAARTPTRVAAVSDWVASQLVPPDRREYVTLETDPVLVGVVPGRSDVNAAQEVIDTFTIAATGGGALLACPRFVADYLNRHLSVPHGSGETWRTPTVSTVSASQLSPVQVRAAASLWRPGTNLPLADLGRAVLAATLLTADVAPST